LNTHVAAGKSISFRVGPNYQALFRRTHK
jgi:hypothetical protein